MEEQVAKSTQNQAMNALVFFVPGSGAMNSPYNRPERCPWPVSIPFDLQASSPWMIVSKSPVALSGLHVLLVTT